MFMHTSLDGFVADVDGGMQWIKMDEPIFEFVGQKIIDDVGTPLYGRVTYGMMEGYWPTAGDAPNATDHTKRDAKWYLNVDKIVLSKTLKDDHQNVTVISDDIVARVNEEKNKPGKDIVIFGSPTASHSLLEHDLVDGFWLFVNPVLLGKGIPLFEKVQQINKLKLVGTKSFDSGVVFLEYEKNRE